MEILPSSLCAREKASFDLKMEKARMFFCEKEEDGKESRSERCLKRRNGRLMNDFFCERGVFPKLSLCVLFLK